MHPDGRGEAPPGTITVVATTTQMQDLVRNVGGARVHVVGILRPNVDPHDFEPTPSAVVALAGAKLVVESGVGLDAWADQLIDGAGTSAPVFDASAGLPLRPDDPHWWGDPTLVERAAVALGRRLGQVDPGHRADYRRNAARYVSRVEVDGRRQPASGRHRSRRRAQARDEPRRLRLPGCALRHPRRRVRRSRRCRRPPSRARRTSPTCRPDQGGARARDLHRVVARPDPRAADRLGGRRARLRQPVRRHARPAGLTGRDLPGHGAVERPRDGGRLPRPAHRREHQTV